MKLNEIKDQFEQLGVGIVGMTYDTPAIIQAFDEKWDIDYPVLRDVDRQHVEAWDIRNEEYGEGTFAYGIPHPGDTHTQSIKLVFQVIQFHELTNAERSPIDGTVENKQQPIGAA